MFHDMPCWNGTCRPKSWKAAHLSVGSCFLGMSKAQGTRLVQFRCAFVWTGKSQQAKLVQAQGSGRDFPDSDLRPTKQANTRRAPPFESNPSGHIEGHSIDLSPTLFELLSVE